MDYRGKSNLPRGIRNNNFGNLKISSNDWRGKIPVSQNTDGTFEQFSDTYWGIRAAMYLISSDLRSGKTLRETISEYAPSSDFNPTDKYIEYVSERSGLLPDGVYQQNEISIKDFFDLMDAIFEMENGMQVRDYYSDADLAEAANGLPSNLLNTFNDLETSMIPTESRTTFKPNWWAIGGIAALIIGGYVYAEQEKRK